MIYLKKLEAYGFKSFADKLEIKFDQPFSAIVGPNGCGKSNISDAIRWVLGEHRPKQLRGKNMQDLVFSGTDTRKSMSYCEVSLFLDNESGFFPIDMKEIIISRKLYRNNESEYFINRNLVRLKDITELLHKVGLGVEGYSIVGQGRMDAILNARPEDRRTIFEEALSLSQFRTKKDETERKLEKTQRNMESLSIILSELERQLEPLKKQASVAEKYLDLSEKLKYKEINAYIYNYDNASNHKHQAKAKISRLNDELSAEEKLFDEFTKDHTQLMHDISNIDETLTQLHNRRTNLSVEIERETGSQTLIREKIKHTENEVANLKDSLETDENEIENLTSLVAQTKDSIQKRSGEREELDKSLINLSADYTTISKVVDDIQLKVDNAQLNYTSFIRDNADAKTSQVVNSTQKEQLNLRLEQISNTEKEIQARLANLDYEEEKLLTNFEQNQKERAEIDTTLEKVKAEIKSFEEKISLAKNNYNKIQQQIAADNASLATLKEFVENYKGYAQSVQRLMKDCKENATLNSSIKGVLANVISVPQKYQHAIDVSLANRLQNVIVSNEKDARYVINYLKYNQYGRVTFLPIESMKPRKIRNENVIDDPLVIARATDVVSTASEFKSIVEALVGDVVIVNDFDDAILLSKKYKYPCKVVTLDGERIFFDGSIEGGSKRQSQTSLLSYENDITTKTAMIAELNEEAISQRQAQKELEVSLKDVQTNYFALSQKFAELNIKIATDKERIEASNTLSASDKQQLLSIEKEKTEILSKLSKIDTESEDYLTILENSVSTEEKLLEELEKLKQEHKTQNEKRSIVQNELSAVKYKLGVLDVNLENARETLKNDISRISILNSDVRMKREFLAKAQADLQIYYSQLVENTDDGAKKDELKEVVDQLQSVDKLKIDLNTRFALLDAKRMESSTKIQNLTSAIDREEYVLERIDEDLLELQQHIEQTYSMVYSQAMQFKDENYDDEETKKEIASLKNSIARLGYVNVNSINDYKEVQERYSDINTQVDDLKKAKADLSNAIVSLTREIETRFESGLQQINVNFKQVFTELFNGGNAKLVLDKDENKSPLSYGIEIEAQPPGKKLQNISLLSGGERTLTAAAILFAILKLNPLPFCVLDEVEAALDDANADKIARYIKKYAGDTQFIVITHKRPTMENADVLYGVTMEEKGVSKIVSVKLTDAIKDAA